MQERRLGMAKAKVESVKIGNTISNTSVNLIQITEDKLELILTRHVSKIRKSNDWLGAAAMVLTILGLLLTTEFRNKWVPADTWCGIFYTLFLVFAFYQVYVVWNCIANRSGVKNIINDIKNEHPEK